MIEGLAVVFCLAVFTVLIIISVESEERIRDKSFKRYIQNKYGKKGESNGGLIFVDPESRPETEEGEQIGAETEEEESEMMFW